MIFKRKNINFFIDKYFQGCADPETIIQVKYIQKVDISDSIRNVKYKIISCIALSYIDTIQNCSFLSFQTSFKGIDNKNIKDIIEKHKKSIEENNLRIKSLELLNEL